MEKVLVVDADVINSALKENGLIVKNLDSFIKTVLDNYYYYDRDVAETCESMKQIIPYVVIRSPKGIYVLERLKKQTEKRLHGKLSVGIGGHINPDSDSHQNPLEHGLYKELNEEVDIKSIKSLRFIGIINDCSTPVSNYHIGLLYEIWTDDEVIVLETEKMRGCWKSIEQIEEILEGMETWSQIALENLDNF